MDCPPKVIHASLLVLRRKGAAADVWMRSTDLLVLFAVRWTGPKCGTHAVATKVEYKFVTDTLWQHFEEIAKDHQNGVFAGTNDLVEKIGGQRPIGLPEFPEAHRGALLS